MSTTSASPRPDEQRSRRPRIIAGALLVALVLAMALSTTYRSASAPVPGEKEKFDPAVFGKENYAAKVKPAIEKNPVDLATLVTAIEKDPEAAGKQYGKRRAPRPTRTPSS